MEMNLSLNINDHVVVRLTDYGIEIYKDNIRADHGNHCMQDNIYRFLLWELMCIFGKYMRNDINEQCFCKNEIIIDEQTFTYINEKICKSVNL